MPTKRQCEVACEGRSRTTATSKRVLKLFANNWRDDDRIGEIMTGGGADWLTTTGRGDRPTLRWSFTVDAPLTDLRLSRETGDVLAADVSGGMYLLDRRGQVRAL